MQLLQHFNRLSSRCGGIRHGVLCRTSVRHFSVRPVRIARLLISQTNRISRLFMGPRTYCCNSYLKLPDTKNTDALSSQIQSSQSAAEVLGLLNRVNTDVDLHYSSLCQELSWLQDRLIVAYIQLQVSRDNLLEKVCGSISQHPGFEKWLRFVDQHIPLYNNEEMVGTLCSIVYLGVPLHEKIVYRLLCRITDHISEFTPCELSTADAVMKTLPSLNPLFYRLALNRLQDFYNLNSMSVEELTHVINLTFFLSRIQSQSRLYDIQNWLCDAVERNYEHLYNPDCYVSFMILAKKLFYSKAYMDKIRLQKLMMRTTSIVYDIVDSLTLSQLGSIAESLKMCYFYSIHLGKPIEERAFALYHDNLRLSEAVDSIYVITPSMTPTSMTLKFLKIIFTRLAQCPDIDVILLSKLAESMIGVEKLLTSDQVFLVQKLIADNADLLVDMSGRLNKIIAFLLRFPFASEQHKQTIVDCMLKKLKEVESYDLYHVSLLSSYLLPTCVGSLPSALFNHLSSAISSWQVSDVYRLATGLTFLPKPSNALVAQQQNRLMDEVYNIIISQRLDTESVHTLNHLIIKFVFRAEHKDPFLTEKLMNKLLDFARQVNDDVTAELIVICLRRVHYYLPEAYDLVTDYIIESGLNDNGKKVFLVAYCVCDL